VLFAVWAFANLQQLPAGVDDFLAQQVSVKSAVMVGGFALLWPRSCRWPGLYERAPSAAAKTSCACCRVHGGRGAGLRLPADVR
jgi:hypothetical protein